MGVFSPIYIYIYNFELAVMLSSLEYDLDVDNSEKNSFSGHAEDSSFIYLICFTL